MRGWFGTCHVIKTKISRIPFLRQHRLKPAEIHADVCGFGVGANVGHAFIRRFIDECQFQKWRFRILVGKLRQLQKIGTSTAIVKQNWDRLAFGVKSQIAARTEYGVGFLRILANTIEINSAIKIAHFAIFYRRVGGLLHINNMFA